MRQRALEKIGLEIFKLLLCQLQGISWGLTLHF